MRWRDVVVMAARGVNRRRGRAVLTVMAIALSAMLFSALLTIAGTARTRVLDQLATGGALSGIQVAAAEPNPGEIDNDKAKPGARRVLDDAALRKIRALEEVRLVSPVQSVRVVVIPPDPLTLADGRTARLKQRESDSLEGALFEGLVGVDLRRVADLPITVLAGRLPAPGSHRELVVTSSWLARFGLDRPDATQILGAELQVGAPRRFDDGTPRGRWQRMQIVGVVAQEVAPGHLLASREPVAAQFEWANAPSPRRGGEPVSKYTGALVIARSMNDVSEAREGIARIGYSTSAPENLVATAQRYLHVVEIVLAGIGLIALLGAALGVSNALFAAVRERGREIGVLKAIGARDRDVQRIFLLEAGVLGTIGGLIGTGAGLAIATAVGTIVNNYLHRQGLAGVVPEFPAGVIAGSILGAGILAVVAGVVPARHAARLPAREAVEA